MRSACGGGNHGATEAANLPCVALFDHVTAGRRWVWSQLRGKGLDLGVWRPIAEGWNLIEDALAGVVDLSINSATGVYLELYGRLVGVARGALDDDQLRAAIIVEALSLFGSGDEGVISRLVRMIVGPDATVKVVENTWGFTYKISGVKSEALDLVGGLLQDIHALTYYGLGLGWENEVLTFSSTHGPVDIAGWFGSAHGPVTGAAGMAHVFKL